MAKTKRSSRAEKKESSSGFNYFNIDKLIPVKYQTPAAIGVIIILFLFFFSPMYFGEKTFQSGDIVTSMSYTTFVETYDYPLWNHLVFCGFPTSASVSPFRWFDLISAGFSSVIKILAAPFKVDYAAYSIYLFVLALSSFLLMRYLTGNNGLSLFASLATVFSTGIIVFLFIGHVSKLPGLAMFPLIFYLLLRMQEKIKLLYILLLIITFHLLVITLHMQIIFYTLFAVMIYFLFFFIRSLIKKDKMFFIQILKSAVVFIAAAAIAVLLSYDEIVQVYEYTPYSTRGTESIVEKTAVPNESSESEFYEYHTSWSFSPGEVLTFIVPSYYGFGNIKYSSSITQNQEIELQTYFGQMPFVDVPMYMGVVIFFLGLYALIARRKEPFVQFLTVLVVISLLISFGRTFPILFDPMFYYFPFFNKFRVPSMILVLVQLSFPVLAGLGVMKIISLKEENSQKDKKVYRNILYTFAGLFIIFLLLSSAISEWFSGRVTESGKLTQQIQYYGQYGINIAEIASEMFLGDLLFAFAFLTVVAGAAYFYINNKINSQILIAIVLITGIIDLIRIDSRAATYVDVPQVEGIFDTPAYIQAIKDQNDKEPFRILNIKQDRSPGSISQSQNYHAYFLLEDLFGYSGIKPRSYQDIIDVVGSPANPTLWRMLNTKYIITDKPVNFAGFNQVFADERSVVYEYTDALPRVYFINKIEKRSGIDILKAIKENSFDPKEIGFTDEEIAVDLPDSSANVVVTHYDSENTNLDVNASGNNFLFFGNTYYPVGWKAMIDGEETKIYKVNHGFMGIVVPKGKHKVEFLYYPESFYTGKYVVLILSSLTLLGLVGLVVFNFKKRES